VSAPESVTYVDAEGALTQESQLSEEIRNLVEKVPGVKEVKIHVRPPLCMSDRKWLHNLTSEQFSGLGMFG
jgi:hypothetical protein